MFVFVLKSLQKPFLSQNNNVFFSLKITAGDTARSAHYFIAASESYALYLDPHIETRNALDGAEMDTDCWHAVKDSAGKPMLLQLPYESLNSSCCFCFLIRDSEQLAQLCLELEMYDQLSEIFEVHKGAFRESLVGELGQWNTDQELSTDGDVVLL